MSKTLIGFATPEYAEPLDRLARSADDYFDEVFQLGPTDLPPAFYRRNAQLFEFRRGFGYWCWKPWLILRQLMAMDEGDVLMYADSQCRLIADPAPLLELARTHDGIALFHQCREGHKNSTWGKGDCFRLMGCDEPKYWSGDNLNSAFSVWTKTARAVNFVQAWAQWCSDFAVVSDAPSQSPNAPDFRDHRHDQTVLSLLAIREGVQAFRDPSQWGNGYEQAGCDYPQIIAHERTVASPWQARPTMSSIVEISAIAACPLRCTYCPQDKLGEAYAGPKALTPTMLDRCLDHLVPGDAIDFSGFTEPCLNPDILELLEMCIARGHRTRIYTTGRGLKPHQADRLAALDLAMVMLHLPDAEGNLGFSAGAAEQVLDILATHPAAHAMTMGNTPHASARHLWNKLPKNYGAMISRAGNSGVVQIGKSHRKPIQCGAAPALDHPVLLPDGRLSLCCCDYGLTRIVGNLAEQTLSEILRGPALARIRQSQRQGTETLCNQCEFASPA